MDALMDMMRDACAKMDEGGKRMDARMDAMEENFKRADARMDAMSAKDADDEDKDEKKDRKDAEGEKEEEKKDARKDAEEEEGKPKEVAADKRKDSEDEKEEKKDARKDADEDEEKDRKDARADAGDFMTRAEAAALREEIKSMQARAPALISDADRERFAVIQEQADPVFQAFNDRAPAPLPGETPTQYKRRLGSKMQAHSPAWKDIRLSAISDEAALDQVLGQVYADSLAVAKAGVDVPRGQLRAHERHSGGHTIIEYEGDSDSWMNRFAGHPQKAVGEWKRPN
jgi:hypothetical protein